MRLRCHDTCLRRAGLQPDFHTVNPFRIKALSSLYSTREWEELCSCDSCSAQRC